MKNTVGNFPAQPHCFSFGGFDIQMNRVIETVEVLGVNSLKVNPWDANCKFEIAHFWGGNLSHTTTFYFCQARSIPCVFSLLLPNVSTKYIWYIRAKRALRKLLKGVMIYQEAQFITVINSSQALVAEHVVGINRDKIRVIPTIIDEVFFGLKTEFSSRSDTIMCVGTICPRKNQLSLLNAAADLGLKVILCGRYDDESQDYSTDVKDMVKKNPLLFEHYADISGDKLWDLYKRCKFVACVSLSETEPASVLEAMICGCQTIISDKPFGKNHKFEGAVFCNPLSTVSIKESLQKALLKTQPNYPSFSPCEHRADSVGSLYQSLYNDCLK